MRRALPTDHEAMLRITRDVWGGNDYFPFVWEQWLNDPRGVLMVAVLEGRVIGLQHVDLHPDGSAWLEGIRVDRDIQGRGIGRALMEAGLRFSREMGARSVGLATSSGNEASNRLATSGGFALVGTYQLLTAQPSNEAAPNTVRLALPYEIEEVRAFITSHVLPSPSSEFYTEGWTAYRLTDERLRLLLALGFVVVHGEHTINALAIATHSVTRPILRLGLAGGSAHGLHGIAAFLRNRAQEAGISAVRGTLNAPEGTLAALRHRGFEQTGDHWMLLYERKPSGS